MKKYTLLLPLVLAFVAILALNQCKKCPEEQTYLGNYPLGEVKDYLYFKPGSYWVYECDSTLELDSQVMIRIDTPWYHKSYIDYQLLFFNRKSITFGTSYNTDNYSDVPYNKNYSYFDAYNINISGPVNNAYDCVFFYPFDSTKYGYGSSPTHYKGYLSELNVLGKSYKDVRVFKVQATTGWLKIKVPFVNDFNRATSMQYYWAKGVGIIKVKVFTFNRITNKPYTHNWNLKRYKLN